MATQEYFNNKQNTFDPKIFNSKVVLDPSSPLAIKPPQYNVIEYGKSKKTPEEDFAFYQELYFFKPSAPQGYKFKPDLKSKEGSRDFTGQIYLDTKAALVLTKKEEAVACVGIERTKDSPPKFRIKQLQGVITKTDELRALGRWEKILVGAVEEIARRMNIETVEIEPAEKNEWVVIGTLPLQTARLRYDVTARRMGYKKDPDTGNFVKRLL